MDTREPDKILHDILSIDKNNLFLQYITNRVQQENYRGWHVSQHNRYDMDDIKKILTAIYGVVGKNLFAIPPGDYKKDIDLQTDFEQYKEIVGRVNEKIGKGTINSLKKNFFPDLDKMGFLKREKIRPASFNRKTLHGQLTPSAVEFIKTSSLIKEYHIFTKAIDKLFGNKISHLAEVISRSDYRTEIISIYELMFILSDDNENLDKIELLSSYRVLKKDQHKKVIHLLKKYADPNNFSGDKTEKRDFHNWKNQSQQIMTLLKTTVYFQVEVNKGFRLNTGKTGFFRPTMQRSPIRKREYFLFHSVAKKPRFELHHIIPIALARNKAEARLIDDHLNLIYIHKNTHKEFSRNQNKNVVLAIDPNKATFSNIDKTHHIKAINSKDAFYTTEPRKIEKITYHNQGLLKSIFEFDRP